MDSGLDWRAGSGYIGVGSWDGGGGFWVEFWVEFLGWILGVGPRRSLGWILGWVLVEF